MEILRYYAILLLLMGAMASDLHDIYERRIFCGRQLDNVMSELCAWYYDSEGSRGNFFNQGLIGLFQMENCVNYAEVFDFVNLVLQG